MARAARYGGIQPSEFEALEIEEGAELARRVTFMFTEQIKMMSEMALELTKAIVKSNGGKVL